MVEPRLEVHGVGRCNPDRRPVARLSPDAQRCQTIVRVRQAEFVGQAAQQLLRFRVEREVGLRQPCAQTAILDALAAYRRQNNHRCRFVI